MVLLKIVFNFSRFRLALRWNWFLAYMRRGSNSSNSYSGFTEPHSIGWVINFCWYKLKIKLNLKLTQRADQALISIFTSLKFSALASFYFTIFIFFPLDERGRAGSHNPQHFSLPWHILAFCLPAAMGHHRTVPRPQHLSSKRLSSWFRVTLRLKLFGRFTMISYKPLPDIIAGISLFLYL